MPQYERRIYHKAADASRLVVMNIAAADADIFQLHQNLIRLWNGNRALRKLNFPNTRHNRGLHCTFHIIPLRCYTVAGNQPWSTLFCRSQQSQPRQLGSLAGSSSIFHVQ